MAPRVDLTSYTGPLSAQTISAYLDRCEDSFEVHNLMNDKPLSVPQQILLVSLKLEEPTVAEWWTQNRTTLKAITVWATFKEKVLARFVPAGWQTEALRRFYAVRQTGDFAEFAATLQTAKNAVGPGALAIADQVFKNHLLFFANEVLQRRVLAIPSFDLEKVGLDSLTNTLGTTWSSLVAEGAIIRSRSSRSTTASSHPAPMIASPSPSVPFARPPLSQSERDSLQAAGGCFRCRKTPSAPDWVAHQASNCPGDATRGITPGHDFVKREPAAAAYVWDDPEPNTSDEEYNDASDQQDDDFC